jgi:Domain of unknown function (DUF397)
VAQGSYSSGNGECVEVAILERDASADAAAAILVRDSRHPEGPILNFPPAEWRAFVV